MGTHKIDGNLNVTGTISQGGETLDSLLSEKLTRGDFDSSTGVGYANFANDLLSTEGLSVSSAFETEVVGGASASAVENGAAKVEKVAGKTASFNQLIRDDGPAPSYQSWTIDNSAGSSALYGTKVFNCADGYRLTIGHKYLIWFIGSKTITGTGDAKLYVNVANQQSSVFDFRAGYSIATINSVEAPAANVGLLTKISAGISLTIDGYICFTDLTLTGEESLTLNQLKAKYNKYYSYNAGSLYPSIVSKVESYGANLWDFSAYTITKESNLVSFTINDNNSITISNPSSSEERIIITPIGLNGNFSISFKSNSTSGRFAIFSLSINTSLTNGTNSLSVSNYNNNPISIYVSANTTITISEFMLNLGSTAVPFTPYVGKLGTINLPSAPITLRGVNDAKDELSFIEDGAGTYTAKLVRNRGLVDLGSLGWNVDSVGRMGSNAIADIANPSGASVSANVLCAIYEAKTANQTYTLQKGVSVESNKVLIYDPDYSSASDFKSAMSGIYLDYELATPTEETLATGLTENQVSFLVQKYGILNLPNENAQYGALPTLTMFYEKSLKSFVEAVGDEISYAPSNIITPTKLADALESKADVDGDCPLLKVGEATVAKSLQTSVGRADETPFAFQTTGGSADVETGIQQLKKLVGVSVVRNQWINGLPDTFTDSGVTFTNNGDGTMTINGTASAEIYVNISKPVVVHRGVPLYISINNTLPSTSGFYVSGFGVGSRKNVDTITTLSGDGYYNTYLAFYAANGTVFSNVKIRPRIFDLTQRYGNNTVVNAIIGNSNQVANLLKFDPSILKQTAYDAGTLVSSQSAKLKSVGYNQWDEEYEQGIINNTTGQNASGNRLRSKNYIRVVGGQTYKASCPTLCNIYLYFYDINKNLLGQVTILNNGQFNVSQNATYMRFYCSSEYGTNGVYHNDICFYLYWDGSRIGYEPYESQTYGLPNIVQRGILKVDGDGNVYADGDVAYPDGTGETRYGIVDLDGESWTYNNNTEAWSTLISGLKPSTTNVLAEKYFYDAAFFERAKTGGMFVQHTGRLHIRTGSPSTHPTGKLVYELATPTPITFDPFPENVWADDFGTTQYLDSDGNEIVGLQGADFFYQANVGGYAETLYVNTNGKPAKVVLSGYTETNPQIHYLKDTDDKVSAVKEALGGTLRQVLAVKESLDFANTAYVDLGTLTWTYSNSVFVSSEISDIKAPANNSGLPKILCTKYTAQTVNDGVNLNVMVSQGKKIWVLDSNYTDATEFQNAMKGVLLAYEKAS